MKGLMMDYQLTVPSILRRAETFYGTREIVTRLPDKSLHRYTYRDFTFRTKKLAVALQRLGIGPGDRVATLCWNHYQHLEAYFAIPSIGAVLHTLNIRLSPEDLSYIVNHGEDKIIIADQVLLPVLEKFKSAISVPTVIVIPRPGEPVPAGYLDYEEVLAGGSPSQFVPFEKDENAAACLCYTSGTTGRPKGVLYSHRSIVLHSLSFLISGNGAAITEKDVVLPVVPMFHACAWGFPFSCTFAGASQVLPGPYLDEESLLNLFESEKVTLTGGVPTVMINVLNAMDANPGRYNIFLRTVLIGGSAMPRSLIKGFEERHGINVLHTWGMTELSPLGTTSVMPLTLANASREERYDQSMKQGLPVPLVEIRARNANGLIPWDGKTMGELEVRGPWVAASYYCNDSAGDKFTSDGWFKTGDIVGIDAAGYIEIMDRSKDLIKSGGEWISSVALENALMNHPVVLEAAVIGLPDAKWMERPMACVVARKGQSVSAAELKEFLEIKFARFWIPDHFVFLDEIPKTSVGKVHKSALREIYSAGQE